MVKLPFFKLFFPLHDRIQRAEQLKEALQQQKVISTGGDKHGDKKDKEEGGAPVKAIEAIDLEAELKKIVGLAEVAHIQFLTLA